jgi:50S ribosomal subunit-associated GTPase HflX
MGEYDLQMQTTLQTLESLNFSSPYLLVMNKTENFPDLSVLPYGSVAISAKYQLGIDELKQEILKKFANDYFFYDLFVPYAQLNEYAKLKKYLKERSSNFTDDGQEISAVIPAVYADKFTPYLVRKSK